MDFRDYAATHTTELLTRLQTGSTEQSRRQLERLRATLDEAMTALEEALAAPDPVEHHVDELVNQLARAAATEAEHQARAAAAHAEQQAAQALLPLHAEIAAHADEIAQLAGALEESRSEAGSLRHDLGAARAELENTLAQLAAAQNEVEAAQALIEEAVADRARHEEAAGVSHSQAEAAEAKLEAVTSLFKTSNSRVKALERAQEEHDRVVRGLQAKLHAQTTAVATPTGESGTLALLDEMLGSFEALSGATTIADVLTTLTEQLAADFCRVALFRVKGNRLEGEHQIGIDLPADVGKVMLPLGMDSFLTRAASSGQLMRLTGSELADSSRTPFAGSPSCALALPVVVNGEALAVVYADDSGQADNDRAPIDLERSARVADALRHHAVALLTRLTAELKALAELRSYADLLLKEMEQMYTADVDAGQSGDMLLNLLKSNLEYARSIYANRVEHESADAASLLEDQISSIIESQRDTPYGRDLAAALGRTEEEPSEARASAGA
jgi:hypothetical protein